MTFRFFLAAGLFAFPVIGMAASGWDVLIDDIDAWSAEIRQEQGDADRERAEFDEYLRGELFPLKEEEQKPLSLVEESRRDRTTGLLEVTVGGRSLVFGDVPRDVWFAPYVRAAAEEGIMTGFRHPDGTWTGMFGPADSVTIEQVAKIAVELSGGSERTCPPTARNPSASGSWSLPYVSCAERRAWAVFSDATVDVRRPATRAEVMVTLLQAVEIPFGQATGQAFADVLLSTQFAAAIERAAQDGIVSGSELDGKKVFRPMDAVNRAEMAKIASLAHQLYAR